MRDHHAETDNGEREPLDEVFAGVDMNSSSAPSAPPITMWWSLGRPGGGIHMRVTGDGSSWKVTDVYVHGPEVTMTMLNHVPVSRLDLLMNLLRGWDPDTIGDAANEEMGQRVLVDCWDGEPSLAELREQAATAPSELPSVKEADRPRLTRPDGTDPDGFYALVAAAYREYAPQTRAPAVEIAREASVPVPTARSWIREARRRGKLPAGRKGKAG